MRTTVLLLVGLLGALILNSCASKPVFRELPVEKYRSKMKAGWLGQMAGVGWGASTEFKYNGRIIPEKNVPVWEPQMINQHYQDDIYVEMTFLKTLEDYGFDVSIRQAGIDFANSEYMLWHANYYGRYNLRSGIAPPFSSHPQYNSHADDIDYQIEADYSGLISPGLPQTVIDLGEKFGRLMNYGDGLYGGQFVGAMYAAAFFENDIHKIIDAGLACIPAESQYAEAIRDVVRWHQENPKDWQKTWQLIEEKYNLNPEYRKFSCSGTNPEFNIDAKINGAYIVMGLLYGEGDMDKTIRISMRCGQDSDCNPSNAAGILATTLGMENLPEKFKTGIDDTTKFSYTAYNFTSLINVCEKLAKEAVIRASGRVEKGNDGDVFLIPVQKIKVSPLQQCWDAPKIEENVEFTPEEMNKILKKIRKPDEFVNVWQVAGPFSLKGVQGFDLFDVKFAPEKDPNYSEWAEMPIGKNGFPNDMIDLEKYFKNEECGVKVWINNSLVHQNNVVRGHEHASDIVKATLNEGWNSVFLKVCQGIGGWGASLAITDSSGHTIENLKYKAN